MRLSLLAFAAVGALAIVGAGARAYAQPELGKEACSDAAIMARDASIPAGLPETPDWSAADNPAVATHYAVRAKDYSRCGMLPKALANFAIALQLDASNLLIYANRGDAYQRANQPEEALRDYSTAISLVDPKQPSKFLRSIYASRAEVYAASGDYAHAVSDLNEVLDNLSRLPTDGLLLPLAEYRLRRAQDYLNQGDFGRAEAEFRVLAGAAPSDWRPAAGGGGGRPGGQRRCLSGARGVQGRPR
jgi:tetratricopeptide (TPR) repeat protein